jgi:hypothetical protein
LLLLRAYGPVTAVPAVPVGALPPRLLVLTDAPIVARKAVPMRQIARIGIAWDASLTRENGAEDIGAIVWKAGSR